MSSYELESAGDDLRDVIDRLSDSIQRPSIRGLLQLMDAANERDRLIDEELAEMLREDNGG